MPTLSARLGLSVAVATVASIGFAAGPAEAQGKPSCTVGHWRLVSDSGYFSTTDHGHKSWTKRSGAAGVRLTIGRSHAYFNFTGAKPLNFRGVSYVTGEREEVSFKIIYRGRLKVKLSAGARVIGIDDKTASGNATSRVNKEPAGSIAEALRNHIREYLVPDTAKYTCSKTRLVTKVKIDMFGVKTGDTLTFRRIK